MPVLEFKPRQEEHLNRAFCKFCGADIDANSRFCSTCGKPLKVEKKTRYAPVKQFKVYPLKTVEQIDQMREYLLHGASKYPESRSCRRNEMCFMLGINLGYRASDLLRLKVSDVVGHDEVVMIEQKTGKRRIVKLTPNVREMVRRYVKVMNLQINDPLFPSNKGGEMTVKAWNKVMSAAGKKIGYAKPLGSHTIRKTYGYQTYMAALKENAEKGYRALSVLCELFGHSSEAITLAYIGIDDEEKAALATLTAEQYDLFKYYQRQEDENE